MDVKVEIKEEPCFLDFNSENEWDNQHPDKQVKIETSDIKLELQDSTCCSQNEEHHLMSFNETITESGIETKIDIKEHCWLEREDLCVRDIKVETQEDLYATKPPSMYKEDVSSDISGLFPSEDLGNDVSFNTKKNSPDYESDRKCQSQKSVVTVIYLPETSVCSETYDDGEIVSMTSSSQQSKFLQQRCTNKEDSNDKSCNLISKHKLTPDSKEANKYDVCDKGLSELSSLKNCKCIDEGGTTQKCNNCIMNFTPLQHLKTHKLNHEGIKPYKCSICNKDFSQLAYLKVHKLIHEGRKPQKCNICYKAFTDLSNLKRHILSHQNIKAYKCNLCNKTFTRLSYLRTHILIHQGIMPHKCNVCNKSFTQLSNLKAHKLIHEGKRPHVCSICNKAFSELSNLKTHNLGHQGIKPHKCNICNRNFTRASHLKTHIFTHGGVKPHKCNICEKAFAEQSNLRKHKLRHE